MREPKSPQNITGFGGFCECSIGRLLGFLQNLDEPPALGCRKRPRLHQRDTVTDAGVAVLIVRLDLRGGPDDLAVQRVPPTVFQLDHDGLLHLVAHHEADSGLTPTARLWLAWCALGASAIARLLSGPLTARIVARRGAVRGLFRGGGFSRGLFRRGFRFCHYESSFSAPLGPAA